MIFVELHVIIFEPIHLDLLDFIKSKILSFLKDNLSFQIANAYCSQSKKCAVDGFLSSLVFKGQFQEGAGVGYGERR